MTAVSGNLHTAAASSLEVWHQMIATRDLGALPGMVHADAVFRSPMAISEYHSRDALVLALSTVITVFEDFEYHRQFASADGLNVVLEFSARVGDRRLKGVDLIRFDDTGHIVEFEVMVRPLSGLKALGAEMGARLGALLPAFKEPSVG